MHHTIEVDNLTFRYPDGTPGLNDVSLHVGPGEKVALVGPNGAGKSTLLLHLNGILTGQGHVRVGGLDLLPANLGQIRAMVGLVFQAPDDQLFCPTVFDDVAYGPIYQGLPADEVRARVETALAEVHMQGYEKRTSYHLSIGEKKRIAIATTLSMNPLILVFDEPTAGLDPRARRSLIQLLRELDMTMLIASHDLAMVKELLPRTVVMNHGQIVADGPTGTILSDAKLLTENGLEPV